MSDSPPTPVWSGSFCIFGVDVKCHILSDGQRIVEVDSMEELFANMNSENPDPGQLADYIEWHSGGLA